MVRQAPLTEASDPIKKERRKKKEERRKKKEEEQEGVFKIKMSHDSLPFVLFKTLNTYQTSFIQDLSAFTLWSFNNTVEKNCEKKNLLCMSSQSR